jgi:DNA-binding transcriptional LysR family regulator
MRLRQIEIFEAVYSNGSISAAARALHVSQPSVSKVLRHTEIQLGIELFRVSRGRLVPTDEAHALYREVGEVMVRIASLQQTARNLRGSNAGQLRIGVVPSLALEILPAAVAEFRQSHRKVTFNIQTLHHNDMLRALRERECDIAFGYDPPPNPRMATRKLTSGELLVIAPRRTFDTSSKTLSLARLAGRDVIGVTGSGPIGLIAAAALERAEVAVHEVASVGTYFIAAALVRQGCGVSMVDEFTASAMRNHDIDVFGVNPTLRFGVHAAWLGERPLAILATRFVKCVERVVRARQRQAPAP